MFLIQAKNIFSTNLPIDTSRFLTAFEKTFLFCYIIYLLPWRILMAFDARFYSVVVHYRFEFVIFTFFALLYSLNWLFIRNWGICFFLILSSYEPFLSFRTGTYFVARFTCTLFTAFGSFLGFIRKAFCMLGWDFVRIAIKTLTLILRLCRFWTYGFTFCEKSIVFRACSWKGVEPNEVTFMYSLLILLDKVKSADV